MFLHILTLVFLTGSVTNSYEFLCPPIAQWFTRARSLCPEPSKYSCLEDRRNKIFSENCSYFTNEKPGRRIILDGGLDAGPCMENRYHPIWIPWTTNMDTGCIYQKSLCSGEGQVEYEDGGVNEDRRCSCDYRRGYFFVNQPENPCYCVPSREDCSCILETCSNFSLLLLSEDQCISFSRNITNITSECFLFENERTPKLPANKSILILPPDSYSGQKGLLMVLVFVVAIFVIVSAVLTLDLIDSLCPKDLPLLQQLMNKIVWEAYVITPISMPPECVEGESVILECEISSGKASWRKDNKDISDDSDYIIANEGGIFRLKIRQMTKQKEGTFTLQTGDHHILSTITVSCQSIVTSHLQLNPPGECFEGSNYRLECTLRYKDAIWYKDGLIQSEINSTKTETNDDTIYSLTFKPIKMDNNGVYTLRNKNGFDLSTFELKCSTFEPKAWPPTKEEQDKMEKDHVIKIRDVKHNNFIHEYTSGMVYKMKNRVHGRAYIINNKEFASSFHRRPRHGSDIDAVNLNALFKELQFHVITKNDLTAMQMTEFLQEERDKVIWEDMECVVLVIMSLGDITGIYGTDGNVIPLQNLTEIFDSNNCPGLNGKPRLVFVQAARCRRQTGSSGLSNTETDTTGSVVQSKADYLIANSTPEGCKAYINFEMGSWFMNAVVWTFKYHAHEMNILDLMTKVNDLVSKERTMDGESTIPECKNHLRKRFYFFPGVYGDPPTTIDSNSSNLNQD